MFHNFDNDLPENDDFNNFSDEELEAMEDEQEFEDDGQPTMYEEYQDLCGGDDWDHGQYDSFE